MSVKQERKNAMGTIVVSIAWIIVSVILFLFQAHSRLDDVIDGLTGKGTLSSLIKIPVSLLWVLIYIGGFFGLFAGAKQFITGRRV